MEELIHLKPKDELNVNISFNIAEFEVLSALFQKERRDSQSLGPESYSEWSPQVESVLRKIDSCQELIDRTDYAV